MGLVGILARYECPSCGMIISVSQPLEGTKTKKFTGPDKCRCGRKGSFRLMDFEPIDYHYTKRDEDKERTNTAIDSPADSLSA